MKKQDSMRKKGSMDRQKNWVDCNRQSMESASSANGWLKSGYVGMTEKKAFFSPSILH